MQHKEYYVLQKNVFKTPDITRSQLVVHYKEYKVWILFYGCVKLYVFTCPIIDFSS